MERQSHLQGGELQSTHEHVTETREESHDERACRELMARISAAATRTLGEIAVVVTAGQAAEDAEEVDTFSWDDAARWSPDSHEDESARDRLDELFGEVPDQEIGTVEDIGWFGLLRREGQPGGVILSQNQYGFRGNELR